MANAGTSKAFQNYLGRALRETGASLKARGEMEVSFTEDFRNSRGEMSLLITLIDPFLSDLLTS